MPFFVFVFCKFNHAISINNISLSKLTAEIWESRDNSKKEVRQGKKN